jgi:NAD(P)-dependent dehydrogenase (short-subunit alcohol dehydrogenase family)
MSFAGKVVIITGATSGVGRATSVQFADQGASVVAGGRRKSLGLELERNAAGLPGSLHFVPTDVRRVQDCQNLVGHAIDRHGRLDILVNAAGVESTVQDFHDLEEEEWDDVVDTNLKGTAFCCRFGIPHMLASGGGVILNIASINAVEGIAHMAPYNASKAAVVQLTRTIATEYLASGIRANAIILGGAVGGTALRSQEAIVRYMRGDGSQQGQINEADASAVFQPAEDVAEAIVSLCADPLRIMTGASIALDKAITAGFASSTLIHMTISGLWQMDHR